MLRVVSASLPPHLLSDKATWRAHAGGWGRVITEKSGNRLILSWPARKGRPGKYDVKGEDGVTNNEGF